MYIYNVTINIEEDVEKDWLRWMQEKHIPEMLATGKFSEAKLCQVMVEEAQGITYSIQYTTDSKETLEKYYNENAKQLRQEGVSLFKEKFVAFRTELKVINHVKNFVKS
ncbi:MAG: DUF4286 family protein [Flavobacteriaceae bacterium]|nr:DUF4286 family protein [Flavobacteriaceae bacterium]